MSDLMGSLYSAFWIVALLLMLAQLFAVPSVASSRGHSAPAWFLMTVVWLCIALGLWVFFVPIMAASVISSMLPPAAAPWVLLLLMFMTMNLPLLCVMATTDTRRKSKRRRARRYDSAR